MYMEAQDHTVGLHVTKSLTTKSFIPQPCTYRWTAKLLHVVSELGTHH